MKAAEILVLFSGFVSALVLRMQGGADNARVRNMNNPNKPQHLSAALAGYLAQGGKVNPDALRALFDPAAPITPGYRFVQFCTGLHAGDYALIDRTTARGLLALRDAGGSLSRDALAYILTGKTDGTESPNTRGVSLTRLDRIIGRVGRNTAPTQVSRSFGARGFCAALGMTRTEGARNAVITLDPEAPMSKRFFSLIDTATEGQLKRIGGDKPESDE